MAISHRFPMFFIPGDSTEDPEHPKIIWPSSGDCPKCRSDRRDLYTLDPQIAFVENQLWNLTALVNHHVKVYGREQLVQTNDRKCLFYFQKSARWGHRVQSAGRLKIEN